MVSRRARDRTHHLSPRLEKNADTPVSACGPRGQRRGQRPATRDGLCTCAPGPPQQPPGPGRGTTHTHSFPHRAGTVPGAGGTAATVNPCALGSYISHARSSAQVTAIWEESENALLIPLLFTSSSAAAGEGEYRRELDMRLALGGRNGASSETPIRGLDVCRGSPTHLIKPEFLLPMNCR